MQFLLSFLLGEADGFFFFLQSLHRAWIGVTIEDHGLHGTPHASKTGESVVYSGRFIARMDHAVTAFRVARLVAVIGPVDFIKQ